MFNPFSVNELKELLANFPKLNFLVVGDLIIDQYIWGKVERISPEAPVPIVNVTKKEYRLGGAGNVAANLVSLGCNSTLVTIKGNDSIGQIAEELLKQRGILSFHLNLNDRPTTLKTRVIAHHQQVVRIDEENISPISAKISKQIIGHLAPNISNYHAIIISDYGKGCITEDLIKELRTLSPNIPILVDPKGWHYKKYYGVTTIKPNFKEFCMAVRHPELGLDRIESYARNLVAELNLKGIVITLGENGVYVLDENNNSYHIPTRAKEVFDVSGAGDTFIASFSAALASTQNWRLAAEFANLTSGIVVSKIGTATTSPEEILEQLQ